MVDWYGVHITKCLKCKQNMTVLGLCLFIVFYISVMGRCFVLKKLKKQDTVDNIQHLNSGNWSLADTKGHQIIYSRLNEVISEKEALKYQPCQDQNLAANATLSSLHLIGSSYQTYEIGDKIYVLATLFDSYGGRKSTGGDHLRARIWNKELNASAPGAVYDHDNGSYTLIFEALWSGRSRISATIAYTREAITAFYRMTSEVLSLRKIKAKYKVQNYEETALCHPDVYHLLKCTNYKDVCNFTSLNSGMPWYCGKPQNPKVQCRDWKFVKSLLPKLPSSLGDCEQELVQRRTQQAFPNVFEVIVKKPTQNNGRKHLHYYQPTIPCSKYNVTKLWYRKYTTGFFFEGRWKLTHCLGYKRNTLKRCLRNKRLYLIGDSTTRQWYVDICERYGCTQFTEKWTEQKWKKPSGCKVEGNNFTVILAPHSQPHHLGNNFTDPKPTLISIPKRLELISSDEDAIFLFHVFAHYRTIHYENFRIKMQLIRDSIEKLLERNNRVKIFIKMPHTFTQSLVVSDFFGYVFSRIISETFQGLYKTVIVLDNKDATNSVASVPLHPDRYVVSAMVDQLFSYVCE